MNRAMRRSLLALTVMLTLLPLLLAVGCGGSSTTTQSSTVTTVASTTTAASTSTTVAPATTAASTSTTAAVTSTTLAGGATSTTAGGATGGAGGGGGAPVKIEVPMTGQEEVPPVQTSASGTFFVYLEAQPSGDYNISYELDVKDIADVTAAHIHLGAKGSNGDVIYALFTGPEKTGSFSGVLAQGPFEVSGLTGALQGKTIGALATAVIAGQAYVNVHTKAHPDGEIRGQIVIPQMPIPGAGAGQ
jgi:hypothetical protein